MVMSTLRRSAALLASLLATPLALAQEIELGNAPELAVILPVIALACAVPIAIVAIINYNEYQQLRERLAAVERLVAAGHTVPHELMLPGDARPTLAEEQRRDVRRGITMLCWASGVALTLYLFSPGQPRSAAWGLLFLILSLGSFLKAWLTGREMARSAQRGPR